MIQDTRYKIQAKKSLGQNLLINPHIVDKIVDTSEINKSDVVLEVGPGTGNLTKKLAEKAGTVIAIEKDHRLIPQLSQLVSQYKNIEVIYEDILKFDPTSYKLQVTSYKVVANIPYYITSNLLRIIFEKWPKPKLIVLTIQKEVAQRIIAKPPHMNLLALSVQYYSEPKIISYISKNNFRPVPKVDSAIIRLTPRSVIRDPKFFNLATAGFGEKRKQLASSLSKHLKISKEVVGTLLTQIGLSKTARSEELSLDQWLDLAKIL